MSAERRGALASTYRQGGSVVSQKSSSKNGFSFNWVILSLLGYFGLQVLLGLFANIFVFPAAATKHTDFFAQGLIIILSYYAGSFVIGVISPGRRMLEPVLGAVLSVATVFSVSSFTPQMGGWYRVDGLGSMATASLMAGVIAALGVYSGEKLMGNIGR